MQKQSFNTTTPRYKIRCLTAIIPLTILYISCKKFVEVPPPTTGLNVGNVYTTDATAAAVLTDIYSSMSAENTNLTGQNITSISLYAALGSDELTLYDFNQQNLLSYYRNTLTKNSQPNYWNAIYAQLFAANNAIEGLKNSDKLTPTVRRQLMGEAKFIRAFCYFYLVNMYGDVPIVLNLDYKATALFPRSDVALVYNQIIADLKEAQELLSENYLKGDATTAYPVGEEERVRPTKWAALALLSRAYLYGGDYSNADAVATSVINQASQYRLTSLNETFLKNSMEAIWQLQPTGIDADANTGEGKLFILPPSGPNDNNPVYLSNQLINSFEPNDQRRTNWTDSVITDGRTYHYAYKYKIGNVPAPVQEYPTILRLSEQYLIRAEARIQQNNISGAQYDLNTVRIRAGLIATTAVDKQSLFNAILHERQVELFTEWGHRWFDLKRTGRLNALMQDISPLKGGQWRAYQSLYPIPQSDLDANPNLIQNQGYN